LRLGHTSPGTIAEGRSFTERTEALRRFVSSFRFDHIFVAQAENIPIISNEASFESYGVRRPFAERLPRRLYLLEVERPRDDFRTFPHQFVIAMEWFGLSVGS